MNFPKIRFMKSELEINKDIINIMAVIEEKYPELLKYISEMPVKIGEEVDEATNIISLSEYYESLETLLNNYTPNHKSTPSTTEDISTF
jgi:hypothetical protein